MYYCTVKNTCVCRYILVSKCVFLTLNLLFNSAVTYLQNVHC